MKIFNIKYSLLILIISVFSGKVFSQSVQENDSIIISALKDELKNNMGNLKEEGFEKPFFIGYRIGDVKVRMSSSSFGSVVLSKELKNRNWNTRIMVGDYNINDENFIDSFEGSNNDVYYESVPLGADYLGLRRLLWAGTNNVYKRAARLYSQKKKTISQYQIDYKLKDLTKTTSNTYIINKNVELASQDELDKLSSSLSGYLTKFDSLYVGNVIASDLGVKNYYYNSEGSSLIYSDQIAVLLISANRIDKEKQYNSAKLDYIGNNFSSLPSLDKVKSDIDWYIEYLRNKSELKELEEDYTGPVLLKGQAVGEFFKENLLKYEKGIFAKREPFNNKDEQSIKKFFEELDEELADEDNLNIGNKKMTVTSIPFMIEFNGENLIGTYHIDADGVAPDKELVLIKDGKILNKLNGRIPAPNASKATGSNRFSISATGGGNIIAPGNLKVDFNEKISMTELMKKFEEEISDNEEEVGIFLDKPAINSMSKPKLYYTYNIKDKESERISKATFMNGGKNKLKKIVAVSDEYYVYNFLYNGSPYGGGTSGVPVSMIVPAAILLKDMDVSKLKYKGTKMTAIVPKPDIIKK